MANTPLSFWRADSTSSVASSSCRRLGRNAHGCQGPGVILHMGNLDPTRAEGERHIDHVAEPIEVLPRTTMFSVSGKPTTRTAEANLAFLVMRAGQPRDAIAVGRVGIPESLDVLQAGGGKGHKFAVHRPACRR